MQVKIGEIVSTELISVRRGVRQGDTISSKLITLALEDIFENLNWDWRGLKIDGQYLNQLRFVDDTVLISSDFDELREMVSQLKLASKRVGLTMNLAKTKIRTPEERQIWKGDKVGCRKRADKNPKKSLYDWDNIDSATLQKWCAN